MLWLLQHECSSDWPRVTVLRDCAIAMFITKLKSHRQIPSENDDWGCWFSLLSIFPHSSDVEPLMLCLVM
ncbi:hypothetical protein RchiOBHm_Chr3g0454001 [Rosa chinensis]|uniref:Uncharacterized protein n=1 Tax=Rosa chinensis TaxID=74649 RepID=A0A2P6R6N4_ROSCH|nr:hypothetical protein RchiOBHm_Chr3g0454001 [Rosa chinensis]